MIRLPVITGNINRNVQIRLKYSSSYIRKTFIDYFIEKHSHKYVKSSSVVPLCDPTVPFVNAGMNQFKGIFLGVVDAPCQRAVNSQKCIRVGGKHNDLDLVGLDGHHHTFFEMLGNWSFGDYYKKDACWMAWDLLLGPYRLKPEDLMVTYFGGDPVLGLPEDRECRDIWREIGVPHSHIKDHGARDNFWEMGATGPCGPCTEIHYINSDGSLTEIWNIVFIQFNREADGSVRALRRAHVDTGLGLERLTALLQAVPSNYHTDLFVPIIAAIHQNSKNTAAYGGSYERHAPVDQAYRRLADHARMVSVCLADGVFPSTSLNLKQIMRKTFKMCTDIFQNPNLMIPLYDQVAGVLGETYPELIVKQKEAKLILEQEREGYAKLKADMAKRWKDLAKRYPEVEDLSDVEMAGFTLGYKEFKETMSKVKSTTIPGELVFKLYDTHGFQEDIIERIATLNNLEIDKEGFLKHLAAHKSRHKTALKEQTDTKGILFDKAIDTLLKNGIERTDDQAKYDFISKDEEIYFEPLRTKVVALLNEDIEWLDFSQPCSDKPYYVVTERTNFYCEEGGQMADTGQILFNEDSSFKVDSVFKIRDFIFHKGHFGSNSSNLYITNNCEVVLKIHSVKRLSVMRNHTAVHLLNAAIRKVLPNSVVCQIGSSVTDRGLSLHLSVYGQKLSQDIVFKAQELIRESIAANAPVHTQILDSTHISSHPDVLTVPGETYPETGLRLVTCLPPLPSKELCCGTHVPSTRALHEVCVTLVRGAAGHAPTLAALTGPAALQARELFCRAQKLAEVIELADPEQVKEEAKMIRRELGVICGTGGAPHAEYAECLQLLDRLVKSSARNDRTDGALEAIALAEIEEAVAEAGRSGRRFAVHFLRCAYLMPAGGARRLLAGPAPALPTVLLACAGGELVAAAHVPPARLSATFTAEAWLGCVLPVFGATLEPPRASEPRPPHTYAEMSATRVSLITCEQLVQDAMRVAIKFAQSHLCASDPQPSRDTRRN